jgi:hypothetical protein
MTPEARQVIRETAELLRSYELHHREEALAARSCESQIARSRKAARNADAAARLEALLERADSDQEERDYNGGYTIAEEAMGASRIVRVRGEARDVAEFDRRLAKAEQRLDRDPPLCGL